MSLPRLSSAAFVGPPLPILRRRSCVASPSRPVMVAVAHPSHHKSPRFEQRALSNAIARSLISDAHPIALFYHLPHIVANAAALRNAFPPDALHAFALKAAPFPALLRVLADAGLGAECASVPELACALAARIPPSHIVFDSPAKTASHLRYALSRGFHINADSLQELALIATIRLKERSNSPIGIRVNPQLGSASIAETFTAAPACQFGEPLTELREQIVQAFHQYPFLSCVHVHVGSQGCALDVIVAGVSAAVLLAEEINAALPNRVTAIDIGGGLTVDYHGDTPVDFHTLAAMLRSECPALFKYRIITEYGRHLAAKTAFIAAQVTSVKRSGGKTFVVCQVGGDVLMRPVYQPTKWSHRIQMYDRFGQLKSGQTQLVDVAGPLCFSGDIIARDRQLVVPEPGDYIVVRDTGAYTLSMNMRHTTQLSPPVYGVHDDGSTTLLRKGETIEDAVRFWS